MNANTATTKVCSSCGQSFGCGMESGGGCWCAKLPAILTIDEAGDCLCPSCLKNRIKKRIDAFVAAFKAGKAENLAIRHATDSRDMTEGIDYYLEGDRWVFSAWYHLKRGYCCGSGCRHCPYGHVNVPGQRNKKSPLQ